MKVLISLGSVALFFHGLMHLMGTAVYLKLGTVENLPFKTALLGGRWELGESGIAVYGFLWALAAIAFVIASAAIGFNWTRWRSVVLGASVFSLVLIAFDWQAFFMGLVINLIVILFVWFSTFKRSDLNHESVRVNGM